MAISIFQSWVWWCSWDPGIRSTTWNKVFPSEVTMSFSMCVYYMSWSLWNVKIVVFCCIEILLKTTLLYYVFIITFLYYIFIITFLYQIFPKIFNPTEFDYRSSHQRCSIRKGVLRNLTKLTGKQLCQSLFFNKVAGLGQSWHRCFPVNFVKACNFIKKETRFLIRCKCALINAYPFIISQFSCLYRHMISACFC